MRSRPPKGSVFWKAGGWPAGEGGGGWARLALTLMGPVVLGGAPAVPPPELTAPTPSSVQASHLPVGCLCCTCSHCPQGSPPAIACSVGPGEHLFQTPSAVSP